jgi:hypothetical protein
MADTASSGHALDDLAWRWHDNLIYGLRIELGDVDRQDWRSDLVFDIDFLAEWLCEGGEFRFRVAPATLTFHQVGDLSLEIDHGDSGGRNALTEWSIDRVDRERLDRPFEYWRWTIHLNMPLNGRIAFCASGFTQTLRTEPRLVAEQRLPRRQRSELV